MKKTLLIMAAGLGSRFGGLKQIEPVGPNKETILEYSIYDALKYGFNKIVFVIKEENYEIFKNLFGKKIENLCEVHYVFQNNDNISSFADIPKDRIKPFGTAHAIYCAKDVIDENFAIINADDFYGSESFKLLSEALDNLNKNEFVFITYKLKNAIQKNSEVVRGICEIKNDELVNLIESNVKEENGKYYACALEENEMKQISESAQVPMNLFGFTTELFKYMDNDIKRFLEKQKQNLNKAEYFIPRVVNNMVKQNIIKVKIITTPSKWLGITYKEDVEEVKQSIKEKHEKKEYPNNLF